MKQSITYIQATDRIAMNGGEDDIKGFSFFAYCNVPLQPPPCLCQLVKSACC